PAPRIVGGNVPDVFGEAEDKQHLDIRTQGYARLPFLQRLNGRSGYSGPFRNLAFGKFSSFPGQLDIIPDVLQKALGSWEYIYCLFCHLIDILFKYTQLCLIKQSYYN